MEFDNNAFSVTSWFKAQRYRFKKRVFKKLLLTESNRTLYDRFLFGKWRSEKRKLNKKNGSL